MNRRPGGRLFFFGSLCILSALNQIKMNRNFTGAHVYSPLLNSHISPLTASNSRWYDVATGYALRVIDELNAVGYRIPVPFDGMPIDRVQLNYYNSTVRVCYTIVKHGRVRVACYAFNPGMDTDLHPDDRYFIEGPSEPVNAPTLFDQLNEANGC